MAGEAEGLLEEAEEDHPAVVAAVEEDHLAAVEVAVEAGEMEAVVEAVAVDAVAQDVEEEEG